MQYDTFVWGVCNEKIYLFWLYLWYDIFARLKYNKSDFFCDAEISEC